MEREKKGVCYSMTNRDLENVREQIQDDLLCLMDGLPEEAQVKACQIVVDRFAPLIKPKYYECGICGHYHPLEWDGDCRDDANRFTIMEVEEKHGEEGIGWEEVPMPEFGEAKHSKHIPPAV